MTRSINFSAGPCTLPLEVLEEAREEFLDFAGMGASVIEVSHRSAEFIAVQEDAMRAARAVAGAPDDFSVLFVQGGATLQFGMVPMNLLAGDRVAAIAVTGSWSKKAAVDGAHHGDLRVAWDGADEGYVRMPSDDELDVPEGARYLHICSNETSGGIRFPEFPDVGTPLVVDMSSEFLARRIPWHLVDVVFGGVQKNLGPAGMAVVFVRTSILEETARDLAAYLRFDTHADKDSMYNTPPVFTVWMTGKVLRWMEARGGTPAIERDAASKAAAIYGVIDESDGWFRSPVEPAHRSHMNIVWRLPSDELEAAFLAASKERGMLGLKGHRSVGGIRASVYAAMPAEGVDALVDLMRTFRAQHA